MEDIANFGKLHKLFDENFMEYTSYVIKERAIPDMSDGLKPVQRRILQTLYIWMMAVFRRSPMWLGRP